MGRRFSIRLCLSPAHFFLDVRLKQFFKLGVGAAEPGEHRPVRDVKHLRRLFGRVPFDHPKYDHRAVFRRQRFDSLVYEPGAAKESRVAVYGQRRDGAVSQSSARFQMQ